MITRIHVNQHVIRRNNKEEHSEKREAPLTIKTYKENRRGNEAVICDSNDDEVARVIYSPDNPLPCGARVWIETNNKVIVL